MNRETVIQNIMNNYGSYGITEDMIDEIIDAGLEGGMTYDFIYLNIKCRICDIVGEEFHCTSADMARAFGVSEDEMNEIIEKEREKLIAVGKNPDDYFREVESTRFMM